jgi:HK97 gp10 family phage protein
MATLKSDLTRFARDVAPKAAERAMLETAVAILTTSQQIVPVDTGALRASGGVEVVSRDTVNVGYGEEYAPYVEYGTVNQDAQPYLTPAFEQNVETFKQRLAANLQGATP